MSRRRELQLDRRGFLGRAGMGAGALGVGAPGLLGAMHGKSGSGGGHWVTVARWLEGYRLAWVRRDPDAAAVLFTPTPSTRNRPSRRHTSAATRSAATGRRSPPPSRTSNCATAAPLWQGARRPSSGGRTCATAAQMSRSPASSCSRSLAADCAVRCASTGSSPKVASRHRRAGATDAQRSAHQLQTARPRARARRFPASSAVTATARRVSWE